MKMKSFLALIIGAFTITSITVVAEEIAPVKQIRIQNVWIFDGVNDKLTGTTNVLIEDNKIANISPDASGGSDATVIVGDGRVLMPSLIDSHAHLMFSGVTFQEILLSEDMLEMILADT